MIPNLALALYLAAGLLLVHDAVRRGVGGFERLLGPRSGAERVGLAGAALVIVLLWLPICLAIAARAALERRHLRRPVRRR